MERHYVEDSGEVRGLVPGPHPQHQPSVAALVVISKFCHQYMPLVQLINKLVLGGVLRRVLEAGLLS